VLISRAQKDSASLYTAWMASGAHNVFLQLVTPIPRIWLLRSPSQSQTQDTGIPSSQKQEPVPLRDGSSVTVVSILWARLSRNLVRWPTEGKDFSPPQRSDRFSGPHSPGALLQKIKWPGRKVDHSIPPSVKVDSHLYSSIRLQSVVINGQGKKDTAMLAAAGSSETLEVSSKLHGT
jgi:hypothetical protein